MRAALFLVATLALAGCKKDEPAAGGAWTDKVAAGKDLFATIKTNMGSVTIKLFSKDAPKTVKNFVGLATGEREWKNPATGELKRNTPLYNGTIFHRVIEGFMIQGGDPLGTGTGNPGYQFEDEFQSHRTFDRVGLLAMANAGPATNGSQFFITTSTPGNLNNKHTIFGEVVKGYEVVEAISKVPKAPGDRPLQPVVIESIQISEAP
ncbi:MAG: peptidylprolyl isomerase [Archangium sp.]|nr:peptidylprolyl isomerase [Archangium sp.]